MNVTLYEILGLGICFLGSCFFSLSETALTSLTPVQSERLASSTNWFKRSIRIWISQPGQILATILVCNTITNSAAAVLFAKFAADHGIESLAVITFLITLMTLVLGEITPKVLARSYPEAVAPYACRVLVGFNYICYPFTALVTNLLSMLFQAFGLILNAKRKILPTDIEHMVLMAGREGSIERDKSKILSSVFQFSKVRVKDIMIPRDRISAISIDASLTEVIDIVRQENHSRYPVFNRDLDRIVGFLHARDLFAILRSYTNANQNAPRPELFSLRTCLRRAFFVSDQAFISRVLNEMKSNRIHLAIVKDEWGNVVGLVTLEDILEQVFGEIEDEHDEHRAQPMVDMYAQGIEVEGNVPLLDLKREYHIDIEPTDSYSTVNGFLQHYASHQQLTPKTVIIWNSYVFSILSVKEGEVDRVRITEIPANKED